MGRVGRMGDTAKWFKSNQAKNEVDNAKQAEHIKELNAIMKGANALARDGGDIKK